MRTRLLITLVSGIFSAGPVDVDALHTVQRVDHVQRVAVCCVFAWMIIQERA